MSHNRHEMYAPPRVTIVIRCHRHDSHTAVVVPDTIVRPVIQCHFHHHDTSRRMNYAWSCQWVELW